MTHLLSKSKYIRGLQCERAMWLDVHEPRLARYTAEQMRRFDRGRDFEYAFKAPFKARFPDGIDLSSELRRNVDLYPARTAELLDLRPCSAAKTVLFEAGFQYDDVLVLADVVCQREDGSLDIYEVKSGSALSDTYRRDAALQHYVISHCRTVHSFSIVYNGAPASCRPDAIEDAGKMPALQDGLFAIVDLTAELAAEGDRIAANIAEMKTIVRATAEPATPTGQHCLTPYACPYQHHCQQGIRQLTLF